MATVRAVRRIHRSITVLGAAITAGCVSDVGSGAGDASVVVRDSAGITIVENHAPTWAPDDGWRLGPEPELTIGMLDGPPAYTFSAARPHFLADGRILVADLAQNELRYFSAAGEHLGTAGGAGDGPGEFARLSRLVVLDGDTVLAFDGGHMRLTLFDAAGEIVDVVTPGLPADTRSARLFGVADTWWVLGRDFATDDPSGATRDRLEILLFDPTGASTTVLDTLDGRRVVRREAPGGILLTTRSPFEASPVVSAGNGRIYSSPGDRFEVRVHTPDGALERIIRLDRPARRVTEELITRYLEELEDQFERFDTPPDFRHPFREMNEEAARSSATVPGIRDFRVEDSGHLVVVPWTTAWEPTPPLFVFDAEGRWLGELEVPEGHAVTDLALDRAAAAWQDELEVNYVRVFSLDRGGHPTREQ